MSNRDGLAEKLEIIGEVFEIEGMTELLVKFKAGINAVQVNAIIIQISGLLIKKNPKTADKIIMLNRGIDEKEVEKLDDGEYSKALKDAIASDVIGFFASSPSSAGKK